MWMMMSVSAALCTLASLILTIDLALGLGPNQDMDFTFLLPAGSTECFFQPTSRQDRLEFEYQVKVFLSTLSSACFWSGTTAV